MFKIVDVIRLKSHQTPMTVDAVYITGGVSCVWVLNRDLEIKTYDFCSDMLELIK